jgi:PAS domain S-box-containing protein
MADSDTNPARGVGPREEPLRQSEERFRLLVESVKDYAIFMLDPDGRVATWNAGAEHIKGYRAEEIIGHHFSRFYPPEVAARGWPQEELRRALADGRFEDEGWRVRKDGSRFWANVVITALFDKDGVHRGFAKVTRDLTERRRSEALEESARRVDEFLAMLAHELRNPLAPIRNAAGVMRLGRLSDPRLEWARDVIDRQVAHLTRLVDDLLDVSRVTSGKITLRKEPLDLALAAARAVESSRPLIDARRHRLELSLPAEPVRVAGDLTRLAQVLQNLLDNAAKYTPEGGAVRLTVGREGGEAVARVRDTGVGVPADLLPEVFELFKQGSRSLDRAEGGLGVGLTLVRRLTEMHGGSVEVHSEGPGRGSEFVVRLPLLADPARGAVSQPAAPGESAPPAAAPRRVLVVDDNPDAAQSLAMLLGLWGHDVRTAHDGPAAVAAAAGYRPDLVFLDIGMPGMNGYEVARALRRLPGLGGVTLVAVTGYGQDDDRDRTRRAGIDHHLTKPPDAAALARLLAAPARSGPAAR